MLPEEVEVFRDYRWRRDPEHRIQDVYAAERFVDDVGFCMVLTDSRRPGPSLYTAVCGRRETHLPRNVQKDAESSLTWTIKDELMRRGRCFYGKLLKGHATLVKAELIPYFAALWAIPRKKESTALTSAAQRVLKTLRKEWEMGTRDLREASGVTDRGQFSKAMVQLQKAMKVIPTEVLYQPTFTYIWSVTEGRFPDQMNNVVSREEALKEIARAYLRGAGMTLRGELARVTGLRSADAGRGNWALVDEEFAERLAPGVYRLREMRSVGTAASFRG
jgi:Winged helix DNA-binding domain